MPPVSVAKRFFSLVPERVLDAVEVRGRRATGYALALNSLENRVYEVEMEDGERLVAKFYRPGRWSREAILEEHGYLAEAAEAEIPVIVPIALDEAGGTLGELSGDDGTIYYALFPKVRGRPPEDMSDEQLARIGRLLARLHHVGARRPAPARPRLDPDTYGDASIKLLVEGPYIPFELTARFATIAGALVAACRRAWVPTEIIRLHGDAHAGNLLWGSDGPFMLDFDDFLAGPPMQDLWLIAPGRDEEGARQRGVVVEAYESLRALDRPSLALVEPLRALRILRYAAWVASRYDDPAFQRAFPDFEEHAYWQREIAALDEQLRWLDR